MCECVGGGGQVEMVQESDPTLAAAGKHEDFWVILAHPVNHVYLLQRLSHGVFVLGVAGNIR